MNTAETLFILQCSYARLLTSLSELEQMHQPHDHFVLLDDSIHALTYLKENLVCKIHVLQSDMDFIPDDISDHINVITYLDFAQLIQQAKKVVTWK